MVEGAWQFREMPVKDIVFSTTDDRGIITDVNVVFGRLAQFSRAELIGAPHNIVRHPAMPGAVFKAMWDTLQAGQPFVGYVRNMAADGKEYVVFATVTPLPGGGYLSVRTRPVVKKLFSAAIRLYRSVHRAEENYRSEGSNRREVAARGVEKLVEQLNEAGFPNYEHFMWQALPAEVTTREAQLDGLPGRDHEPGILGQALAITRGIMGELDMWMDAAEQLHDLTTQIRAVAADITADLTDGAVKEETIVAFRSCGPQYDQVVEPLQLWLQMQPIVTAALTTMVERLTALADNSARTRFRIALSRLHTTMIANFTVELIDGEPDAAASAHSIEALTVALRDGMQQMRASFGDTRNLASASAESVAGATFALDVPRQVLELFTNGIQGLDLPADLAREAARIAAAVQRADDNLARLNTLIEAARRIGERDIPFNINADLAQLVAAAPLIATYRSQR